MNTIMKRTAALTAALFFLLALLPGCSVTVTDGGQTDGEKPLVVSTIFPQYDVVNNIAKETVRNELLIPYGTETHDFGVKDLTASRLETLHGASLIIAVGGESDELLLKELKTALAGSDVRFLLLTDLIKDLLNEEQTEGMEAETDGEDEEEIDEHVWTSPRRAAELARGIGRALSERFPANRAEYEKNTEEYAGKLDELDVRYQETLKNRTYNTLIFADRFPFRYLCHDYGIEADAAFAGCSSSVDPSLATLDHLYRKAKELKLPAILCMEGSDPKYAKQLASKTGGQALMLHSCHIVSEEDAKKGYLGLLAYDLDVLKIALGVREDAN